MSYPTSLDSFTTKVDGVDYPKASHINSLQTAVEGLEEKVGIDDSSVPTSIDYILKNNIWPIGSVFLSVVSTDPSILLGFGTWEQIAEGKMLVGQTDSDSDFNVAEETGGSKSINIAHTHTGPSHAHTISTQATLSQVGNYGSGHFERGDWGTSTHNHGGATGSQGTGNTSPALSSSQSIVNPYFVVYAWKRTA